MQAQASYTAWRHRDEPRAKVPRPVYLFLGRGHWRHRREVALDARQQRLTPESVQQAQAAFARLLGGQ